MYSFFKPFRFSLKQLFVLSFLLFFSAIFSQKKLNNYKDAYKLYRSATDNFFNLNHRESVKQAETVLVYSLNKNNHNLTAKTYNLMGLNLEDFGDHDEAIKFYNKGIFYASKVKNDTVLGWLYNNIGGVYGYNEIDIEKSNHYFKKAFYHTKNIKNSGDYLVAGINIAANLIELEKYEEGKAYLDKMNPLVLKCNEIEIVISMYASYATYYDLYKNDYISTEITLKEAVEVAKKDNSFEVKIHLLDIYKSFYMFYEKHNKLEESFKYLKLYSNLKEEVYNEEQKNIIEGKDKSFRLDLVNERIEKVEQENRAYLKQLTYNKYYIIFLSVLVLTFVTLMYFLYKNFIKNKKINRKLKKANIELHKAKQKTEEIAKLKSQFMSTVSHELRTPLYGVIGMTEIIENEHTELKDSKYLNSLKFSAKYLLSLINDVLSLSKIESEKIELNFESIHLKNEVEIITNSLEVIANQYQNKIILEIHSNVPNFIKTDKTRLSQIIINLLSNSLKFTKNGIVKLNIQNNPITNCLEFKIVDTGIGIPQKYIDNIFDKFTQVERNSDEQFQGTGLGLAIVKRFVDLFNGTIKIESEVNKGTTIEFSIPLIIGKEIVNSELNSTAISIENCKVLVVEDNKINQIVTQKLLEKHSLKCTIAYDGYNALEILETQSFDIILMDIHMPGINGFETAEKIHQLGIKTPIIALTASDKYELEGDISKYKMQDILVKPFEFPDLQNLIIKYINK